MSFIINLFTKTISSQAGIVKSRNFCTNCVKILSPRKNHLLVFENKSWDVQLPASHGYFARFFANNPSVKIPTVHIKKRPLKKKKGGEILSKQGFFNIIAYNTAKEYDLEKLTQAIEHKDVYTLTNLNEDIGGSSDVLHAISKYQPKDEEPREIFFFRDGSIVMWNISKLECMDLLKFLQKYEIEGIDENILANETEMMNYRYCVDNPNTIIQGDTIVFGPDDTPVKLKKFTISNAMALSVNLGTWEATLDQYIESMEAVTEDLKYGKIVKMKQHEVLKKSGQLFALRHVVNLSSDLLDTPDFYWDRDELERIYQKVFNYFCINRRTKVMNEKINHCLELVDLLSTHLSDKHHVRLEWMIIILILIEVGFEVLHYAQAYYEGSHENYEKV